MISVNESNQSLVRVSKVSAERQILPKAGRSAFVRINQPDSRLSRKSLPEGRSDLEIPDYLDANIQIGHVHIGPGDLFRSLIAPLAHEAMQLRLPGYERAGIAAVSLRGSPAINTARRQDCLYSITERGPERDMTRIIASVPVWINGKKQPAHILKLLTDPGVSIVTTTITKNGYCQDSTNKLNLEHPEMRSCLLSTTLPHSAFGFIVEALRIRRKTGLQPFVLMPCDNLSDKARVTRNSLIAYAAAKERLNPGPGYEGLSQWIDDNLICPVTMVDRITPNGLKRPQKISYWHEAKNITGVWDGAALFAEPYRKMMVQKIFNGTEIFPAGAPAMLSVPGCGLSDAIEQHEIAKRLLLNGMHVVFGWIGARMGFPDGLSTVQDLMRHPKVERFARELISNTIKPALKGAPDLNLDTYSADILCRLVNERLPDALTRLNNSPETKFPERVLPSIAAAIERNRIEGSNISIDALALAVACWFCSRRGIAENGAAIIGSQSDQFTLRIAQTENLDQFLSIGEIWDRVPVFGNQILPQQPEFRQALERAVCSLSERSVLEIL